MVVSNRDPSSFHRPVTVTHRIWTRFGRMYAKDGKSYNMVMSCKIQLTAVRCRASPNIISDICKSGSLDQQQAAAPQLDDPYTLRKEWVHGAYD